jgi:WD40 repeat protein
LWNVATGKKLATLHGPAREVLPEHSIYSLAFQNDGNTLACGYHGGTVCLWDTITRTPGPTLSGHLGPVRSVAFAPDGKTLATAGEDKTVRLWDLFTKQERLILHGLGDALQSVAFSPDGKILASASVDGDVSLWYAARDEETVSPEL